MVARSAPLDWAECVDDNDDPSLIAYAQGHVCVVIHGGKLWSILRMDKAGGTVVLSGVNPRGGPVSITRTAVYVNRRFSEYIRGKKS